VTIPSGISGVDYLWQDGSVDPQYVTTQSGVFILLVSNNCGSDSDTILVDISGMPPSPVLGPDTTLCEGISMVLSSAANAETSIEWQDGSSSPTYTVTGAGIYILSESNRCGDASDTIVISYLDAPDPFTLGHDTTLCPGESIILNSPSTAYETQWQDGSQQPMIIADQAGAYSLQLSNECGTITDAITVDYDTRIPQLSLDSTISWCEGDIITLDATQPFIAEYLWSTGATSPSIQITSPGQYAIDVSTLCNVASQNVDVISGVDCMIPKVFNNIYVPNVFSPNDDGINDVFSVSFGSDLQITSMHGSIYDRWGNLVYSDEAIPFIWDGYFTDETMMAGVYVYTITVKYADQGKEIETVLAGDVTLVR
jgi:gliding motility-associated-like protein